MLLLLLNADVYRVDASKRELHRHHVSISSGGISSQTLPRANRRSRSHRVPLAVRIRPYYSLESSMASKPAITVRHLRTYTVSHRKEDTMFLGVTSPNIVRFSKLFHLQTQWQIRIKVAHHTSQTLLHYLVKY